MIQIILLILFSIIACVESTAYGIYEISINKNKVRWHFFAYTFYYWFIFAYSILFNEII